MPPTPTKGALVEKIAKLLRVAPEDVRWLDRLNNDELPLLYAMIEARIEAAAKNRRETQAAK